MDILLMGPPGAGKGTQGALLSEALGVPTFATGNLLRDAVSRGTPLGLKAKAVMEAGKLVSDDIILGVIQEELDRPAAANGVIFDGVVRTIPQAEGMERLLAERGRKLNAVLFFDVPDAEILGRIERRRGHRGSRGRRSEGGCHAAAELPGADGAGAGLVRAARESRQDSRRGAGGRHRDAGAPRAGAAGLMITLKSPREIETMAHAGLHRVRRARPAAP